MRIHLNKSARREELYTYKILGKKIFKNKNVKIGDNPSEFCPDIYSFDKIIGVEVATCETNRIYKSKRASKLGNICRSFNRYHNKTPQQYQNVEIEKQEYYKNLQTILFSKLHNLNENVYKGVKQISLVILSNLSKKRFIKLKELQRIINLCHTNFDKQFEKTYMVFQNIILCFNKFGNFDYKIKI